MRKSKLGRVLGLSILAALSLMAFSVASAQAGLFRIGVGKEEIKEALKVEATGAKEGLSTLLVPGRNLKLVCHAGHIVGPAIIFNGHDALGKVLFLECLAINHNTGAPLPCTVANPTATALLLPKLHPVNVPYILAEPDPGPNFTIIKYSGATCPLPAENPVTGTFAGKVTTNNAVVNLIKFDPAEAKLTTEAFGTGMKFGGFPATFEGSATVQLTGAHAGTVFGIS